MAVKARLPLKRLIDVMLQLKPDKGLNYSCDKNHNSGSGEDQLEVSEEENEVGELFELSLSSLVGLTTSKTRIFRGSILGQSIIVLIDGGVTPNFTSTKWAGQLELQTTETMGYKNCGRPMLELVTTT
ncbi:unnamed protein product [Fraxinus pennsylvanica]|uniref:Uncharacterized protein n=1 Tax=Fraxinus pennsylvanica TaxID=56036 RepID=A0AAD1ZFH2_9LAMI|nr:unnamed protein product [Fraxinus pennsylvanica]